MIGQRLWIAATDQFFIEAISNVQQFVNSNGFLTIFILLIVETNTQYLSPFSDLSSNAVNSSSTVVGFVWYDLNYS